MIKINILFLILFIISFNAKSQKITLLKTWINEKNEALIIDDSCLYYQKYFGLTKYDYKIEKDTLFMIEYRNTDTKEFPSFEDYRIVKLNSDTLLLEYNKKWMGVRTNEIKRILFIDSIKARSKIENYNKFLFQKTYLSGTTIRTKLEIDNMGDVYFWDRNDSSNIYFLELSKSSLDSFKNWLNIARIENNDSVKLVRILDNPNYIFTITSNKWTIRKSVSNLPYLNWELSNYLYCLTKRIKKDGLIITKYEFSE